MDLANVAIKIDGTTLIDLVEADLLFELNRIAFARLRILERTYVDELVEESNTIKFPHGKEVSIQISFLQNAKEQQILFQGMVVRQVLEADSTGIFLTVELKDEAVRMTKRKESTVFRDLSDSQVFNQLADQYQLQTGERTADTVYIHPELVKHYCSDWDFLLSRADVNGLWVYAANGAIEWASPTEIYPEEAQHQFTFGADPIYNLHLNIDSETQLQEVSSSGWNIQNQSLIRETVENAPSDDPDEISSNRIATDLGWKKRHLQSSVPLTNAELKAWSNAKLNKSRFALIRGSFTLQGLYQMQPLEVIEISGLKHPFSHKGIISAVRLRLSNQGWFTDVQLGCSPSWFAEQFSINDLPAAGLLPSFNGLQIGVVDQFQEDPNGQYRVKVFLPSLGESADPIWARMSSPDAGGNRGYFFRPETGDEVVVGFFNDDPRQAVILSAMHSQHNPPPIPNADIQEENRIKGIFSKAGVQFVIDDKNQSLQLITSEKQSVLLDGKSKTIELQDENGNTIQMDENGITIKSTKDLAFEAKGNIKIKGKKIDVN